MLIESKQLADRHGLKVAAHVSGGTLSFDKSYLQILRKTGQTDAQMLMRMGLFDSSSILVHGINCTSTDLRLIADSGASLIYCPTSEAVRGGGIGPAAPALAAGVNVALGSDGPMVDEFGRHGRADESLLVPARGQAPRSDHHAGRALH